MNCRNTSRLLREALKVRRWLDGEIAYPAPGGGQRHPVICSFDSPYTQDAVARHLIRWSKLTRAEIRKYLKDT